MPLVFRRLAPLLAVGIVLAACGSGSVDETTSEATVPATASGETAPRTEANSGSAMAPADAPAALQFAAPLIGGGDIELTTLAGRPVLLWFWAPW